MSRIKSAAKRRAATIGTGRKPSRPSIAGLFGEWGDGGRHFSNCRRPRSFRKELLRNGREFAQRTLLKAGGVFGLLQDYTPVIDGETILCHLVSN
jgi:hypothetical protein